MTISLEKSRSEARLMAVVSAALAIIAAIVPSSLVKLLALIALPYTAWLFYFHGTTWVSFLLQDNKKRIFQVGVAILTPALLSLYFLRHTPEFTFQVTFGPLLNPWFLLPCAFIWFFSKILSRVLDRQHPFRGYLIASVIIFIFCLYGFSGIALDAENGTSYADEEFAKLAASTAKYFGQYLLYVAVSYLSLLRGMRKSTHKVE